VATLGSSAFDPTFTQAQGLVLAGLEAGQTYSLEVVLTDPKGNARTVSGLSFTTPTAPDTAAPVITGLVAAPSQTSALVTWTTNEPASAAVQFGVAGGPLRSATSLDFGTSHAVPLTGLVPGATYFFQAVSRDASGNEGSAAGT